MSKSKRPGSKRPILSDDDESLAVTHPNAAGIDVGARELWVAVSPKAVPAGESVRSFSTFTRGLHEMADWLQKCGVKTVALESTGVYWIPVYEILEDRGIEPWLVNSFEAKSVPGRKSDAADCQWLRDLHKHGLLRRSFRPTGEFGQNGIKYANSESASSWRNEREASGSYSLNPSPRSP